MFPLMSPTAACRSACRSSRPLAPTPKRSRRRVSSKLHWCGGEASHRSVGEGRRQPEGGRLLARLFERKWRLVRRLPEPAVGGGIAAAMQLRDEAAAEIDRAALGEPFDLVFRRETEDPQGLRRRRAVAVCPFQRSD